MARAGAGVVVVHLLLTVVIFFREFCLSLTFLLRESTCDRPHAVDIFELLMCPAASCPFKRFPFGIRWGKSPPVKTDDSSMASLIPSLRIFTQFA